MRASLLEDLKRLKAAALMGEAHLDVISRQELEVSRLEWLAHSAAQSAGVYETPTPDELSRAYEAYVQALPASEYHVAHILVAEEIAATQLIERLNAHADFAELARAHSADDSKASGGDLGWISLAHLPSSLRTAITELVPGGYSAKAVRTPYGWHIVKLLGRRSAAAPLFDQVKAQLATNVEHDRYGKFLNDALRASALR